MSVIAAFLTTATASGQAQLWMRQIGTGGADYAGGIGADADGVFLAISVTGGIGPVASQNILLKRFDGAGNQVWTHLIGTTDEDAANALAPDGERGTFAAGMTDGSFGGPNAGYYDVWLARYNRLGNQVWIRQVGSPSFDSAYALAPDSAGGVFVAGMTLGRLAWPPLGNADSWLARYDGAGSRLWIRQFGSSGSDWANALAQDGSTGVFVAGQGGLGSPAAGHDDAWLARYDAVGARLWARRFGTTNATDIAFALAPDGAGGVFIAGSTNGILGGPTSGNSDIWLARCDETGDQLWVRQFGTFDSEHARALATDGAGGAYIAGYTYGGLAGPNAGPPGTYDAWLARYDGAGNQLEIRQIGTTGHDAALELAADGAGGTYAAGETTGSLGGPNAGPSNTSDTWLARFGPGLVDCYADCNADDLLTVADFGCFQTRFVAGDPYTDCNSDGSLTVADFACFQTAFVSGCP